MSLPIASLGQLPNVNLNSPIVTTKRPSVLEQAALAFAANLAGGAGQQIAENSFAKDYASPETQQAWYKKLINGPALGEKEYLANKAETAQTNRDALLHKNELARMGKGSDLKKGEMTHGSGLSKEEQYAAYLQNRELTGFKNDFTSKENAADRAVNMSLNGMNNRSREGMAADANKLTEKMHNDTHGLNAQKYSDQSTGATPAAKAELQGLEAQARRALADAQMNEEQAKLMSGIGGQGAAQPAPANGMDPKRIDAAKAVYRTAKEKQAAPEQSPFIPGKPTVTTTFEPESAWDRMSAVGAPVRDAISNANSSIWSGLSDLVSPASEEQKAAVTQSQDNLGNSVASALGADTTEAPQPWSAGSANPFASAQQSLEQLRGPKPVLSPENQAQSQQFNQTSDEAVARLQQLLGLTQ